MPEAQLNRWIRRIGLVLVLGIVAFVAFYAVDRIRISPAPIVDQETATLEDLVRKDPADAVARGQLADLYSSKGRYEEAIAQYSLLIDAGKEVELASLGRAKAYQATKKLDLAMTDYTKVVEIAAAGEMADNDPILAAGYYGVGSTLMDQGKPKDAIAPLGKALAIQRTDADVLFALGSAYLQADQPKDALQPLTLAVTLVPNDWPEPYRALEQAYTKTGDASHAEWAGAMAAFAGGDAATATTRLQKLVDGDLALQATVGLGVISESTGDTAAAADWYRKALAIDPNDMTARLGLGRVSMPAASPSAGSN